MILKIINLLCFVPLCFGCMQTAQRSADAVIQQPTTSADSNVINQNARMLPNSHVQKTKQNIVVDVSKEVNEGEESSTATKVGISSFATRTQTTVPAPKNNERKLTAKKNVKASSTASSKSKLRQVTMSPPEALSTTAKTKQQKTISSSSSVISKSTLPNGGDTSEKLLPEAFETEEKESVEEETEENATEEVDKNEARTNKSGEETANKIEEEDESGEKEAGETGAKEIEENGKSEKSMPKGEVDAVGVEARGSGAEQTEVELEKAGEKELKDESTSEEAPGEESEESGEKNGETEENGVGLKEVAKIGSETGERPISRSIETIVTPQVPEEINLCHTCELPNLLKIFGNNNETAEFYEPYIGERTFSAVGCAQTLVYCNVPLYLGKWPDNYMQFYPIGPMYRAVRGGGLASEISCSKDGHWKVGNKNINGVSCIHE